MEKYVRLKDINDLLMQMYQEPRYQHEDEDYYSGISQVAGMIVGIETFEFEEPKVGKWISASTKPGVQIGMKCSLCGARIKYSEFFNGNHRYCHKCGAEMIKE
jgi:hypothetical protein